jgi:hypothetical protein
VTNVAALATNQTLIVSNASRRGVSVYNDSTATLYLKLGSTLSSSTSFTVKMAPDSYYEVPFSYTGTINGTWSAAIGSARVTEVTP